jgi:hypothetical protein
MGRTAKTVFLAAILLPFLAGALSANPLPVYYIHDSPYGTPNGTWDDQWSGGTVLPAGELVNWQSPPYGIDCDIEENASIVTIPDAASLLHAYTDPPLTGVHDAGSCMVVLPLRQTCYELCTVTVALLTVAADGGPPVVPLLSTSLEVATDFWPPALHYFFLGDLPEMNMAGLRYRVDISTDGLCTDLVWGCHAYECFLQTPLEAGNPVEPRSWAGIKRLYR